MDVSVDANTGGVAAVAGDAAASDVDYDPLWDEPAEPTELVPIAGGTFTMGTDDPKPRYGIIGRALPNHFAN